MCKDSYVVVLQLQVLMLLFQVLQETCNTWNKPRCCLQRGCTLNPDTCASSRAD